MTRLSKMLPCALPLVALMPLDQASAYDTSFAGKVTDIEPTYMPGRVVFQLDTGASGCAAGALLTWTAKGDTEAQQIANTQAILSVLLTAKAASQPVQIYVTTASCTVDYLHLR